MDHMLLRCIWARKRGALSTAELFASVSFVVCSLEWGAVPEKSVLLVYPSFVCVSATPQDWIYPIKKIKSNNQCCSHALPFPVLLVANFMQTDFFCIF